MKFAITADIHLSRYGQDPVDETSGLPERLDSIKGALYSMMEVCRLDGIKVVMIAGDILHTKSVIYALAQDMMLQFFEDHSETKFYVIDGNHDLSSKGADAISALRALKSVPNVHWITKQPEKIQNILFVPYSVDLVQQIKEGSADILISHFGLSEGVLNSGISIVSKLSMADLRGKYKLVLLGHYHKPQEIIEDNISMYYVGSPIQLDWGEKGDQKRFLIIDSENLSVAEVPTTGYRHFIEVELTADNKAEAAKKAKEAHDNGHYVKIVQREKVDVKGFENFNIVDKTQTDATNRGITSSMTQREKLQRYLEVKEIPEEQREEFLEIGIEIINACEVDQ
jgi:DNA repair exonuclease SbcCD nuclease subunit